ncbi:MAG: GntR family transcriptional regulator [Solirubrobacteraceae bacterium]|jgi:GntR family transcriptional regulator
MSPAGKPVVPQLESTPLAEQAWAAILSAILERRFERRLPSEEDLAKLLNVSRTTIRTALQRLEQDGIVSRRRAIGTTINAHVAPANLALQRLVGFDQLLEEKGHTVRTDVSWKSAPPPAEAQSGFSLDPTPDCCITSKAYFADDRLAIHIRDIIPWDQLVTEDPGDRIPASMFEFSKRFLRQPIDHAVVRIVPVVKNDKSPTALRLKKGGAFVRLYETHYSTSGDALAFSIIDGDPQYVQLEVFRRN